ncbi:neurotrypsin-like [Asterias rubens]|uniref:neurotrypsin-like n=1 Tax=Asterias rubens TaxID=7604 RepID=UPI00145510FA|nr:neurotrypsin-like [Asterias rubens]
MSRGPPGQFYFRAILCGLLLVLVCSSVGVLASPYDDSEGDPAPRHFPPAPFDAERHNNWQPFNNRKLDLFEEQMSSRPRSAAAYNNLQHELWDKKMADDEEADDVSDDVTNYEERKWQSLQNRVADSYFMRIVNYLLKKDSFGGSGGISVLPQGEEYQADGIEVERRASKLPETCGRRRLESSIAKRVVLGHASKAGWPWLVQLTQLDGTQPYCGGTLLNEDFVLTAAHCFDRHEPNEVFVTLGDKDRSKEDGTEQRFRIECVYIHEAYIPKGDYKDDVALVRLKTGGRKMVKMNPAVQPACLPPQRLPKAQDLFGPGDECFVVGWGFTDPLTYFNSKHPTVLHQARLPILSPKDCRDAYGALYTDNMICAGHMTGEHRTDACKGDSGGPLLCRSKEDQWVVWGIVSWGHNYFCNGSPDKPIPTVYTKVEEYLPWIRKRLRLEQC